MPEKAAFFYSDVSQLLTSGEKSGLAESVTERDSSAGLRGISLLGVVLSAFVGFRRSPLGGFGQPLGHVRVLAEGKTMREAANVLSITMRTVAFHKYRVMREFGFTTNADFIRFAMERHIIVG